MCSLFKGAGPCSPAGVNVRGYLHELRHRVIEETLVAFAEIAFSAKTVFIEGGSVFHTSAATDGKMSADQAFIAEILLCAGKGPLFAAGGQLLYRRLKNVSQSPLRLDEKITAESIAGMLDYDVLTALSVESTNRVPSCNVI